MYHELGVGCRSACAAREKTNRAQHFRGHLTPLVLGQEEAPKFPTVRRMRAARAGLCLHSIGASRAPINYTHALSA